MSVNNNDFEQLQCYCSTRFFRLLQEASQKGIDRDVQVWQNGYNEFAVSVFQGNAVFTDKATCHSVLVYTRIELATLSGVSEKKIRQLICTKPLNSLIHKLYG
jgi:hypothetical protein